MLNKGCLYSALLLVTKITLATAGTAALGAITPLASSGTLDLAAGVNQTLTFNDTTNIDINYSCLTKAIDFTADGDN